MAAVVHPPGVGIDAAGTNTARPNNGRLPVTMRWLFTTMPSWVQFVEEVRSARDSIDGIHSTCFAHTSDNACTVKTLYLLVNPLHNASQGFVTCRKQSPLANPTVTRRRNALALFHAYAERSLADGAPPKGLEQAFAASLQISPSMWSQIKSARPIGDKLARQFEVLAAKPRGWMDETHEPDGLTAAEKAFLDVALQAWRATDSAGRRQLRARMAAIAQDAPAASARVASG